MTATVESKPRAPKATLVMKLINGKMVPRLAKAEESRLSAARVLCLELQAVPNLDAKAKAAADAILDLMSDVCE